MATEPERQPLLAGIEDNAVGLVSRDRGKLSPLRSGICYQVSPMYFSLPGGSTTTRFLQSTLLQTKHQRPSPRYLVYAAYLSEEVVLVLDQV